MWISHPTPSLRGYINELIEEHGLKKSLKSAAYVMLDREDLLKVHDPDYLHLDSYLNELDPLLGSLLFDRVIKLKNPELGEISVQTDEITSDRSLMDLIRIKDYTTLWENILDYPLPFICELIKIFDQEKWTPRERSSREIYWVLIEHLGTDGWKGNEEVKWQVVSKQKKESFVPLDEVEMRKRNFELHLSQDLISRPDRVIAQKFKSRGRINLTDAQLGLSIYKKMIRRSDLDGMIHIPIYANNGAELAEFVIPAPSESHFQMDEDGMFFTVRNKEGLYSVDIDAIAALLLPVKQHAEAVYEIIPSMLEKASGKAKLAVEALNLISTLHRGREYTLWDLKELGSYDKSDIVEESDDACNCCLGVDFGNTITKIALVLGENCTHEPKEWNIPSIIHYQSPSSFVIGNQVITEKLEKSAQTFKNWKYGLQHGKQRFIRIQNTIITAQMAFEHFFSKVLVQIRNDVTFETTKVAIAYQNDMPSTFESWSREIFQKLGFVTIDFIDHGTALILGSYRLKNQRDTVLSIDVGSSQMNTAIAILEQPKSRKRKESARMQEKPYRNPKIIAKLSIPQGSDEITKVIRNLTFNEEEVSRLTLDQHQILEDTKLRLAFNFEDEIELSNYDVIKYSLNEKSDQDAISVLPEFQNSRFFLLFQLLIRNVMIKAIQRGIDKTRIDTLLLSGQGIYWPPLMQYIVNTFPEKKIIIEDDVYLGAKGAGLLGNNQTFDMILDKDVLLKIAGDGIVSYTTILPRGDPSNNRFKSYEIRPQARFEAIVIDCWSRTPIVVADESVLPLKDEEQIEHRRDTEVHFQYERIYRELTPIGKNSKLQVQVSPKGRLSFSVIYEGEEKQLITQTTIL
ncbi:MAG: hypothetical protein ACXADH_02235 [Candidatus Kariarchaeaceae archaeon]|jgi:hypothetical protein